MREMPTSKLNRVLQVLLNYFRNITIFDVVMEERAAVGLELSLSVGVPVEWKRNPLSTFVFHYELVNSRGPEINRTTFSSSFFGQKHSVGIFRLKSVQT